MIWKIKCFLTTHISLVSSLSNWPRTNVYSRKDNSIAFCITQGLNSANYHFIYVKPHLLLRSYVNDTLFWVVYSWQWALFSICAGTSMHYLDSSALAFTSECHFHQWEDVNSSPSRFLPTCTAFWHFVSTNIKASKHNITNIVKFHLWKPDRIE